MNYLDRISINPEILHGKPAIQGTRIPVYIILQLLGVGHTIEEVLHEYPDIRREDVLACLQYGARLAERKAVRPRRERSTVP